MQWTCPELTADTAEKRNTSMANETAEKGLKLTRRSSAAVPDQSGFLTKVNPRPSADVECHSSDHLEEFNSEHERLAPQYCAAPRSDHHITGSFARPGIARLASWVQCAIGPLRRSLAAWLF